MSNVAYRAELETDSNTHDEHSPHPLDAANITDSSTPFVRETKGFTSVVSPRPLSTSKLSSIGWYTPAVIVGGFIGAMVIAIANYIYFYVIGGGGGRPIDEFFILVLSRAFSTILTASASAAFAQLLWWYLRRRSLPLEKVEALFQLNFGPLNLYQLGILKLVPLLWFFGLILLLVPLSASLPGGSLVVEQVARNATSAAPIPALDVDFRGNGSAADLFKYAMFSTMPDGEYKMPILEYSAIGKRSLLEGAYLTRTSPCGVNCSYDLQFAAPSLQCKDANPVSTAKLYFNTDLNDTYAQNGFYRASHYPHNPNFKRFNDLYEFVMVWAESDGQRQNATLRALNCVAMAATYNAHVNYTNSIQTITVGISNEKPLNATALFYPNLFYGEQRAKDGPNGIEYIYPTYTHTKDELNALFNGCQLLSMVETLTEPLKGDAVYLGTDGYNRSSSLIQETPLTRAAYDEQTMDYTYMDYNLSPEILRDLMTNVFLSIFNDGQHLTSTSVTTETYRLSYVFKSPWRLIAVYAADLIVTAIFLLLGLIAMFQDGVAATPGGFLQILCTTTHEHGTLNRLARQACSGGKEGMSDHLKKLKVRFGEIVDMNEGLRFAAFGTEEETSLLVNKRAHGGM
ncbi:Purine catabolism protein PucG [Colletotrichum asianum]